MSWVLIRPQSLKKEIGFSKDVNFYKWSCSLLSSQIFIHRSGPAYMEQRAWETAYLTQMKYGNVTLISLYQTPTSVICTLGAPWSACRWRSTIVFKRSSSTGVLRFSMWGDCRHSGRNGRSGENTVGKNYSRMNGELQVEVIIHQQPYIIWQ